LVEAVAIFVLVFVVIAVATDSRSPSAIAALAIGLSLAVGVLVAGPITGGAVNPARALGPMVVAARFDQFWIYIVGPVIGGHAVRRATTLNHLSGLVRPRIAAIRIYDNDDFVLVSPPRRATGGHPYGGFCLRWGGGTLHFEAHHDRRGVLFPTHG
jgi:hypothetical protein